jgi:mannose-6-phosphate isomerase
MDVLQFYPLIKRAIWGGTRLAHELGKETGGITDAAESWEISDLPGNTSVVATGLLAGTTLRQLMEETATDLLGRHRDHPQFPLLIKFLDAQQQLSVQVHPKDPVQMPDGTWRPGKTESWIVLSAKPESRMYLGLCPGIGEEELRTAVRTGDFERCLYSYSPKAGDCIHLSPGTVHALGGGLLVAEIQQPSDITYRFYDWGRTDAQGRSRELHIEQSFASTDFDIGPVHPVVPRPIAERTGSELLVECPHYTIVRHFGSQPLILPDDDRMHILIVLSGSASNKDVHLVRGQTAVVPASRTDSRWELSNDAIVLDTFLPD